MLIWRQDTAQGRRAILKMYRHRGPIAFWRERTFRFRAQREFEALNHLRMWEVPCSEPIAWAYGRSSEHGRFEILAMWEVPEAASMRELARTARSQTGRWDLAPLYRSVRRMHESGMFHRALHLRNILAGRGRNGDPAFYIIDTPHAQLFPRSIAGTSMALFDWLTLSSQVINQLEWPVSRIPLEECGLDEPARRAFLGRLPGFRPTRFDRQRIWLESAVRLGLARRGGARIHSSYRQVNP